MKSEDIAALVAYRMERAEESMEAAADPTTDREF